MRSGRWVWLVAALLAAGIASAAHAEERVALVIGNSAYAHLPVLDSPRNDAAAIADKLRQIGFKVTLAVDLDHAAMAAKLQQFRHTLAHAGTALFYYAGQGLEAAGRDFLVPIDADLADAANPEHGIIDLSPLVWGMKHGPNVSLLFVDASRDNPLPSDALPPEIADPSPPEDPANLIILLATGPGETAAHGAGDAHSPFTSALLAHMATPGLKIQDMLTLVRDDVVQATGSQTPWSTSSLERDFFLSRH
jgi:uncharacterized caspase-like protein